MNRLGDDVLAGARLALDENAVLGGRDPLQIGEQLAHARRASEHVAEAVGRRLFARHRLVERNDAEGCIADAHDDGARQERLEDANPAHEHAVRGSAIA